MTQRARDLARILGVCLACWSAAACSGSGDASDGEQSGTTCAGGTSVQCACADGSVSSQVCLASGVFGACNCAGGGAGTNATGSAGASGAQGTAGVGAGSAGTAGGGGAAGSGGGAAGNGGGGTTPSMLPTAKETCPTISEGDVMFLGHKARVWVGSDGLDKKGPLVIYWHGTCSSPQEVLAGVGTSAINDIKAQGGMVVALYSEYVSPNGFCGNAVPSTDACPGKSTGNGVWCYEDFDTADEIVACAIEQVGIDTRHIHAAGMSAGGLQTVAMGYARSGYLASITSYSGGLSKFIIDSTSQDPSNKFAAMIVYGGDSDGVGGANFHDLSVAYQDDLTAKGQFSFLCNHDMGHTIPLGIGAATYQFFQDHPFGVSPEPYATMLPASLPSYCMLP